MATHSDCPLCAKVKPSNARLLRGPVCPSRRMMNSGGTTRSSMNVPDCDARRMNGLDPSKRSPSLEYQMLLSMGSNRIASTSAVSPHFQRLESGLPLCCLKKITAVSVDALNDCFSQVKAEV